MHSEQKERSAVYRTLVASVATAAVFLFVAATAWGETPYSEVGSYKCDTGEVVGIAISPDGKTMVLSCYDAVARKGSVKIIPIGSGSSTPTTPGQVPGSLVDMGGQAHDPKFVQCVNEKGQTVWCVSVYNSVTNTVIIFDPATGRVVSETGKGSNHVSQDGVPNPTALVGSPTSTPSSRPSSAPATPTPVAVVEGPDGLFGRPGTIEFRDGNDKIIGTPVPLAKGPKYPGGSPIHDMAFAPGGSYVAVVGEFKYLCIVQADGAHLCKRIPLQSPGMTVGISPDGSKVGVGTGGGQVIVVDPKTGKQTVLEDRERKPGIPDVINCVEFTDDGKVVAGGKDGIVRIWDPVTKTCVVTIDRGSKVTDIATGPGNTIAVGGTDGEVKVYQPTPMPTKTPASTPPKTSSSYNPPADPSMVQVNAWPY